MSKRKLEDSLFNAFRKRETWKSEDFAFPKQKAASDCRIIDSTKQPRQLTIIDGDILRNAIMRCVSREGGHNSRFWVDGAYITGDVDLQGCTINGWISLNNCVIEGNLLAKHAQLGSLYLCNVFFDTIRSKPPSPGEHLNERAYGLSAPGLKATGGLRLGAPHAPLQIDYVDLRAATIGGDAVIEAAWMNYAALDGNTLRKNSQLNAPEEHDVPEAKKERPIFGVRERCAFYARGANFERSLRIASSVIFGEVRLTDAEVEKSLQIEGSLIANPENYLNSDSEIDTLPYTPQFLDFLKRQTRQRGPDFTERSRSAYAIVADRIRIRGRFSTAKADSYLAARAGNAAGDSGAKVPSVFLGKVRMHGAIIHGALFLTQSVFSSNRRSAISFTGSEIHGSISFSHSLIISAEKYFGIVCRRINLKGDFFLHDEETARNASSPWQSVECFSLDAQRGCPASNMLFGVDAKLIPCLGDFLKLYEWYSWRRSEIDQHLKSSYNEADETGDSAASLPQYAERATRNWIPNGVLLDNSTINGRLTAKRAIVGYPRARDNTQTQAAISSFIEDTEKNRENRPIESVGAERVIIGHGVYLTNGFLSYGKINFRRADVSGNFSLRYSTLRTPSISNEVLTEISTGAHHIGSPESYKLNQTLNIGGVTVTGNLDLSGCLLEPICVDGLLRETGGDKRVLEESVVLYGSRAEVDGIVLLNNGIKYRGLIKFHGSKIGGSFAFEPILPDQGFESSDFERCKDYDWRLDLTDTEINRILSLNLMTSGLRRADLNNVFTELETEIEKANNGASRSKGPAIEASSSLTRQMEQLSMWLERRRPRYQSKFLKILHMIVKQNREQCKSRGRVDLVNANCGSYSDDFHALRRHWILRSLSWLRILPLQYTWAIGKVYTSWPDNTVLDLEGFHYKTFSGRGLDSRLGGATRIEWLKHQYIDAAPIANWAWLLPALLWMFILGVSILAPTPREAVMFILLSFPALISLIMISLFALPKELLFKYRLFRPARWDARPQGLKWHSYKSQPWLHCAAALRESGREEAARRVRLSRERLILFSRKIYPLERWFRAMLLILFGRGLVRSYPAMWFAVIFLAGWFVYDLAFKSNLMRPSEPVVLIEMAEHRAEGKEGYVPPIGYETPRAFVYAFERMTPGMPFTHENRWAACAPEHIAAAEFQMRSRPDGASNAERETPLCFPAPTNFFELSYKALNNYAPESLSAAPNPDTWKKVCGDKKGSALSPLGQLCATLNTEELTPEELTPEEREPADPFSFVPSDTSAFLSAARDYFILNRVVRRLDSFIKEGGGRAAGWAFLSYGWLLVAGFAISISQLLLKED